VLDVESGALHQVSDDALEVLKLIEGEESFDENSPLLINAPHGIVAGIKSLIDAGKLFSKKTVIDIQNHMSNRKPVVKALCLHMAHECNLRCKYCFAGDGQYSLYDRGLMPIEVGKKALDFLVNESGSRRNLEVDFFGGEPMLNFETVKELVKYGRSLEEKNNKKFRFTLTTNGVLLTDESISYINENFDNVVLSLDGRQHVNDNVRKKTDGSGSYDIILPKINKLTEARNHKNYYVRGTYTRYNMDFANDVLHMADLGFKNISVEPVVAPQEMDYAFKDEDLPVLFKEYDKLAVELLKREKEGNGLKVMRKK